MCLEYLTDPDEVQRIWQDYTVFSFARNPWSRAISSYRYNNKRAIEPECHAPFTSFAAAPPLAGALCYRKCAAAGLSTQLEACTAPLHALPLEGPPTGSRVRLPVGCRAQLACALPARVAQVRQLLQGAVRFCTGAHRGADPLLPLHRGRAASG
jgi:hypothetical protein